MLRAGFARLDITPGPDLSLIGYDFRQAELPPGNAGVLDPLYVRVLALDDGEQLALWVTLDLCIVSVSFARSLRQRLADRIGIGRERVLLSCSHTHSGPWMQESALSADLAAVLPHCSATGDPAAAAYTQGLVAACEEAVSLAAGLTVPVQCWYREAPLGLGYCRRVPQEEGVALCWNPQEQDQLAPSGSADPTLSLLEFRQLGGEQRWVVFSHGFHPVTLGKTSRRISADWPGQAMRLLAEYLPGTEGLFVLGACGDTHPWMATQADPGAPEVVGRVVAAQMALLLQSGGRPLSLEGVQARERSLDIEGTELDLVSWRLGGCQVLASPTELFAELSAHLRREIGSLFQATNTNGWTGYWPTAAAFAEGNYEVNAAKAKGRGPESAAAFCAAASEVLNPAAVD